MNQCARSPTNPKKDHYSSLISVWTRIPRRPRILIRQGQAMVILYITKVAPFFGSQYYKMSLRYLPMIVNKQGCRMPYDMLFRLLIYDKKWRTWVLIWMILTLQWSARYLNTIVVLCKWWGPTSFKHKPNNSTSSVTTSMTT